MKSQKQALATVKPAGISRNQIPLARVLRPTFDTGRTHSSARSLHLPVCLPFRPPSPCPWFDYNSHISTVQPSTLSLIGIPKPALWTAIHTRLFIHPANPFRCLCPSAPLRSLYTQSPFVPLPSTGPVHSSPLGPYTQLFSFHPFHPGEISLSSPPSWSSHPVNSILSRFSFPFFLRAAAKLERSLLEVIRV